MISTTTSTTPHYCEHKLNFEMYSIFAVSSALVLEDRKALEPTRTSTPVPRSEYSCMVAWQELKKKQGVYALGKPMEYVYCSSTSDKWRCSTLVREQQALNCIYKQEVGLQAVGRQVVRERERESFYTCHGVKQQIVPVVEKPN